MRQSVLTFLALLCTCAGTCFGQRVSNVQFKSVENIVVITYYLDQRADIEVSISTNGGRTFRLLHKVSGDVGKYVSPGYKTIYWNPLEEVDGICSDKVVFKVHPDSWQYIKREKRQNKNYEFPHHSFGLTLGNRCGLSYKRCYSNVAIQYELVAQAVHTYEFLDGGLMVYSTDFNAEVEKVIKLRNNEYFFVGGGPSCGFAMTGPESYCFKFGQNAIVAFEWLLSPSMFFHLNIRGGHAFILGSYPAWYIDYSLSLGFRYCFD